MKNIAVFASGSGTNAEKIFERFAQHPQIKVSLLLTNNPKAGVIERANRFQVPVKIFNKKTFQETDEVLTWLRDAKIDFIVLAGFLLKVPDYLIQYFPDKIVNIHPALLPAYGGKGMYGMHVHLAVVEAKEEATGITVHLVNEHYDEGRIIFQESCQVAPTDTPEEVAQKVHLLEHKHYPEVIENLVTHS